MSPIGNAPEHVVEQAKRSLKRLKTDYMDLFLIHMPVSLSVSKAVLWTEIHCTYIRIIC